MNGFVYLQIINKINMHIVADDEKNQTQLMAERDIFGMRLRILREVFEYVAQSYDRYSCNDTRSVATIDVKAICKQIGQYSQKIVS